MQEISNKSISLKPKEIPLLRSPSISFASIFQLKKQLYLILGVCVVADALIIILSFWLAFITYFGFTIPAKNILIYLKYFPVYLFLKIFVLFACGLYNEVAFKLKSYTIFTLIEALILSAFLEFFIISVIILYSPTRSYELSRFVLVLKTFIELFLLGVWRLIVLRFISAKELLCQRTLLVGLRKESQDLIRQTQNYKYPFRKIIGYLDSAHTEAVLGVPYLGEPADVREIIKKHKVNEIVVMADIPLRNKILRLLGNQAVNLKVFPQNYEMIMSRFNIDEIGGIPLIEIKGANLTLSFLLLKRIVDITVACVGLLLFLPVFIPLVIIYALFYGGEIIYSQPRVGKGNKVFKIYKLRTMVKDAEKLTGPVLSSGKDPRVLGVGRILRRLHLDEVPQLFNVLLGDMSLVGPRPERPEMVEKFSKREPLYNLRHSVQPGLTGLAQVKGAYSTSFEYKLAYDLLYVHNMSLLMDLKILFYTPKYILAEIFGEKNIY